MVLIIISNFALMRQDTKIIVAISSNHDSQKHAERARMLLDGAFGGMRFSPMIWTTPIGIQSDRFLNGLAVGFSPLSLDATVSCLKNMEQQCDDNKTLREQNIINMDLDLLLFGRQRLHQADWEREYIKRLLACLDETGL